jgi:hypothetical protein
MHSVVGVHPPTVVNRPKYTYDCTPCNGANVNARHFIPKRVVVDLPINIKVAVVLKVMVIFLEKLQSKSKNLLTRERLNIVLPTVSDARHKVH